MSISNNDDWFKIYEGESLLEQGDIIVNVEGIIPIDTSNTLNGEISLNSRIERFNGIVLTQTCDIVNKKAKFIMMVKVESIISFLETFLKDRKQTKDAKKSAIKQLKTGANCGHYLMKCGLNGLEKYIVANFYQTFVLSKEYLIKKIEKNKTIIRLAYPYRQALSQAFGRFFMRVDLPNDIMEDDVIDYLEQKSLNVDK